MENNNSENIDILKDLEFSLNTENNNLKTENTEIDTSSIIESAEDKSAETISTEQLIIKNDSLINLEEKENNELSNLEVLTDVIIEKKRNSFISSIIFLAKYVITSSLIFAVLLITTNYSAYLNIAKSYIFKWEMASTQQKLISSVEASNIKEKYSEETLLELEKKEKESEKLSIKQMKKEQDKKNINLNIEITPYENRVIIPKIWKNIPLVDVKNRNIAWEEELNDIFMHELEKWIVRYPGSAKPWEDGTSFIFGHSSNFPWIKWDYNDVFSLLDNVEFGDEIIVYYNQEKYVYTMREKKVITPWDVAVLERNKKKSEITLMTCWPIWTTINRLIVTWELAKVNNY